MNSYRIISDCSSEEKLQLFQAGVLKRICEKIAECGGINKLNRLYPCSEIIL